MLKHVLTAAAVLLLAASAAAQTVGQTVMSAHTLIEAEQQHGTSGTSIEPASACIGCRVISLARRSAHQSVQVSCRAFASSALAPSFGVTTTTFTPAIKVGRSVSP